RGELHPPFPIQEQGALGNEGGNSVPFREEVGFPLTMEMDEMGKMFLTFMQFRFIRSTSRNVGQCRRRMQIE
ncbi:hypothetical protein CEXT_259881, partial [Caerostris extrusa]